MMKVLGIQKGKSKKGNDYCMLHLSEPLPAQYGIGERVSTEFINTDIDISGVCVGSSVELMYSKGANGRAYITSVEVIE